MRRRFLALFVLLCLAVSLSAPAGAVEYTGFSDVDSSTDYAEAIRWAAEQGYVDGYPDGRFGVHALVTRAQTATIFYRAAGRPDVSGTTSFSDVRATAYYRDAASWAEDSGLMGGYPNGQFGVNDPVTRQQLVTILWRWAGSPDAAAEDYADENTISTYAQTAVDWSRSNRILAEREDGRFAPNDGATRAEVVSALYQYRNPSSDNHSSHIQGGQDPMADKGEDTAMPQVEIEVGGQTFRVTLLDNPATRTLLERLPMTISMSELNGNEKYYYLSEALPTNSQRPGNMQAGDLMLYGSDCLVLFYESFSSGYSYTRLGSADDPSGLAAALGRGNVEVSIQII